VEEAKAEAACKAEEEHQVELAWECTEAERRARVEAVQEAHLERQRWEFEVWKVQEQQQRLQAQVEAIMATQGSGEAMAEPAAATGVHLSEGRGQNNQQPTPNDNNKQVVVFLCSSGI